MNFNGSGSTALFEYIELFTQYYRIKFITSAITAAVYGNGMNDTVAACINISPVIAYDPNPQKIIHCAMNSNEPFPFR